MKNINKYTDLAAYTADANRPTNESTVSSIEENKVLKFDGKNVIVDKACAEVGDIAVFDKNTSTKRFIKTATYNATNFPSNLVVAGVVYHRTNDKVYIVSKNNQASARWADGYKVKLSGFDFVIGGIFSITVNSTTTASIPYTSSDTLTTVSAAIALSLSNAGFTSATGWIVAADNVNNCIVIVRNYHTPAITKFTVTDVSAKVIITIITPNDYQCTLTGLLEVVGNIYRVDGGNTSYAGVNYYKFYNYYYTNGGNQTNEPLKSNQIIKYSVFNITDNPILIGYYGAGEEGYIRYLKDKMVKYPYSKLAITNDDGKLNTNLLANIMYQDIDGVLKPSYPSAYNSNKHGVVVDGYITGFEAGNWWIPSVREMYLLIKDVLLDNSDIINKSLGLIGGDMVLASSFYIRTSTEYSTNNMWCYDGRYGVTIANLKYISSIVRAVTSF